MWAMIISLLPWYVVVQHRAYRYWHPWQAIRTLHVQDHAHTGSAALMVRGTSQSVLPSPQIRAQSRAEWSHATRAMSSVCRRQTIRSCFASMVDAGKSDWPPEWRGVMKRKNVCSLVRFEGRCERSHSPLRLRKPWRAKIAILQLNASRSPWSSKENGLERGSANG